MALAAVPARLPGRLARDVGQQGLDVAAPLRVEPLVRPALLGLAEGRLAGQLPAEGAVHLDQAAVGGERRLGGRRESRRQLVGLGDGVGRWKSVALAVGGVKRVEGPEEVLVKVVGGGPVF